MCFAQDHLHEYFNLMHSVNTAFNERSTALLTVQTLATEISSLNTRIEKLMVASSKVFGGDKTRNRKIEELKEALMTMEESRDSATAEYERIKVNFVCNIICFRLVSSLACTVSLS